MANTQTTVPTFVDGQVLYGAQLNQSAGTGVPVFATTITRDAGFGGAGEKTLAEGQLCYLESTNVVQYYDGAAWATLAPAPAVSSGLTFISTTNLSGTQTNITNCFSTTYTHYEVRFSNFACGGVINMRYGTSGTPDTGSNYCNYQLYVDSSSVGQGGYRYDDTSNCLISNASAVRGNSLFLSVSSPFESVKTTFAVNANGATGTQNFGSLSSGLVNTSTSYTDLVLLFPSGPVTSGTVSIYGLAKA